MLYDILKNIPIIGDLYLKVRLQTALTKVKLAEDIIELYTSDNFHKATSVKDSNKLFVGMDRYGNYEKSYAEKLDSIIKPNFIVFDIGASDGVYSVFLTQKKKCIVYAFEVMKERFFILKKNKKKFNLKHLHLENTFIHESSNFKKNQITIDDFCKKNQILPDVIKMDIEGHEQGAFKGMAETLKQKRPYILMEFHERLMKEMKKDYTFIIEMLVENNYSIEFNNHHWFTSNNNGENDLKWHSKPPNSINYALFAYPN